MKFQTAEKHLANGKAVSRKVWEKDQFVFRTQTAVLGTVGPHLAQHGIRPGTLWHATYVYSDGQSALYPGWRPSDEDREATDWVIEKRVGIEVAPPAIEAKATDAESQAALEIPTPGPSIDEINSRREQRLKETGCATGDTSIPPANLAERELAENGPAKAAVKKPRKPRVLKNTDAAPAAKRLSKTLAGQTAATKKARADKKIDTSKD